jgi:hypothetical protein
VIGGHSPYSFLNAAWHHYKFMLWNALLRLALPLELQLGWAILPEKIASKHSRVRQAFSMNGLSRLLSESCNSITER